MTPFFFLPFVNKCCPFVIIIIWSLWGGIYLFFSLLTFKAWLLHSFSHFDLNIWIKNRKKEGARRGWERGVWWNRVRCGQKSLSETHGHCVLQRFAPQRRDARSSPHVTVRGATQLWGARYVRRAGEGGRHSWKRRLVEVGLQTGAVGGQAVRETHGVWWRAWTKAALWQWLRHAWLATQSGGELQLGDPRHPRSPARVVGVEGAQAVLHGGSGRKLWQARCWEQGTRCTENISGLLPFLPLSASILEPNLKSETQIDI